MCRSASERSATAARSSATTPAVQFVGRIRIVGLKTRREFVGVLKDLLHGERHLHLGRRSWCIPRRGPRPGPGCGRRAGCRPRSSVVKGGRSDDRVVHHVSKATCERARFKTWRHIRTLPLLAQQALVAQRYAMRWGWDRQRCLLERRPSPRGRSWQALVEQGLVERRPSPRDWLGKGSGGRRPSQRNGALESLPSTREP